GAEAMSKRLEKGLALFGAKRGVARQDLACERGAGGFATAREQLLAEIDDGIRPRARGAAAVTRAVQQGAAAIGNGLKKLAKEGRVHARCIHAVDGWPTVPRRRQSEVSARERYHKRFWTSLHGRA